jgi:hypothetical protein
MKLLLDTTYLIPQIKMQLEGILDYGAYGHKKCKTL